MIPMPMTPDDALNITSLDPILFQLFTDTLFDGCGPAALFDAVLDCGCETSDVFADAKVEEQFSTRWVFNEEREGGTLEVGKALYGGLNEGCARNAGDV